MSTTLTLPEAPRRNLWVLLTSLALLGFAAALPALLPLLQAAAAKAHAALSLLVLAQGGQLAIVCGLAAWVGLVCAPRAGFDAPWLRALAGGTPLPRVPVARAMLAGTLATAATLVVLLAVRPWAPAELWAKAGGASSFWRGASSAFYGGVVEELLMRWALLSALVLLFRRNFWVANVAAALIFGFGHLPAAVAMGLSLGPGVLAHVLLGNLVAGLAFGWLYRRHGLEAAMIAHATADVWLHGVVPFLA